MLCTVDPSAPRRGAPPTRKGTGYYIGAVPSGLLIVLFAIAFFPHTPAIAQERPYFTTDSQDLEEPGNLEIETFNAIGKPKGGDRFIGSTFELEYGVKTWW